MNALKSLVGAIAIVIVLASATAVITPFASAAMDPDMKMPATAEEHTAESVKYDREAMDLDDKAKHHAEMAKRYRARASGGSKQETALLSLAQHCERLAKVYREAAVEARELAKSHLAMAKAM